MKRRHAFFLAGFLLISWDLPAQEKPLERTFAAGATQRYRVELLVRTELAGQRPVRIGVKAYAEPFTRFAEARVSWLATKHVLSVTADGAADIEETLSGFSAISANAAKGEEQEWKDIAAALEDALRGWARARVVRYRASRTGDVRGFPAESGPPLGEALPQILTPWLTRALRPVAALPAKPIRFGERWQEPRTVTLPGWENVQGAESGEWMEMPESLEPAARLQVVQQITGLVKSDNERLAAEAGDTVPVSVTGKFHGELLAAVSLMDGRLLGATRSAAREIAWTLAPGEGFEQPLRFQGRLSVQVRIEECSDNC
jgi:hypothetical protein